MRPASSRKGTKSAGAQRQYCGTAGRIENCQIGVFWRLRLPPQRAFLDRALYLPAAAAWANDPPRRRAAGIPPAVAFATKGALARPMLARAFAADLAAWAVG